MAYKNKIDQADNKVRPPIGVIGPRAPVIPVSPNSFLRANR